MPKVNRKQVLADRDWWRRVGAMFDAQLIGWTDRHVATFTKPLGECSGVVAAKLLELEDRIKELPDAHRTPRSK